MLCIICLQLKTQLQHATVRLVRTAEHVSRRLVVYFFVKDVRTAAGVLLISLEINAKLVSSLLTVIITC